MNKLLKILLVTILICAAIQLHAQVPEFLRKNSHKMEGEEFRGKIINANMPSFTEEGTKLDQLMTMRMMGSPEVGMDFYGDKDGNIVAILFREATKREQKAKLAALMARVDNGVWEDKEFPDFKAINMDWDKFNLSDFKGSVVALNFWFIGCKPCIMEMPELNQLVAKYKGQDVKFIAVALDSRDKLVPFLQRMEFDYDVVPDARKIAKKYDVAGYPTHFIIDQNGKVQFFQTGYNGALSTIMDKKIEGLLK
jgi:peroxiredoxin